jgi:hypothetical protein
MAEEIWAKGQLLLMDLGKASGQCPAIYKKTGERCALEEGHATKHRLPAPVHRCHARGCKVAVKPELLMCLKHWRMVPRAIQARVWQHYRPGQCDDKRPSEEWHKAADDAIEAVAARETRR